MDGKLKYDLNLSAKEFVAYLDCKLKFFIMKDLSRGTTKGPRGKRDYSRLPKHIRKGMFYHAQFASFHSNWGDWIQEGNEPPTFITEDAILLTFWQFEAKRLEQYKETWYPLATELYLASEYLRGTIDRIDQISPTGCQVMEYKTAPGTFDRQELLFYASLATKCQHKMRELLGLRAPKEVVVVEEIAVYYYYYYFNPRNPLTDQFHVERLPPEELTNFDRLFESVRAEINLGRWEKKENCQGQACLYRRICETIRL